MQESGKKQTYEELLEENRILRRRLLGFERTERELEQARKELTQTQAALEIERKRLQAVLKVLPVGVLIVDAEGKLLETNQEAINIWGNTPIVNNPGEYGQYKGWWADSGDPIAAEDWAAARALLKGESSVNEEVIIEAFDGKRKTVLNSAAPIYDEQNRLIGAVVAESDITRQAELRRQIDEERQNFYSLLMDAPAYIAVLNGPDLVFEFINEEGKKFYQNQDIIGKPLSEVRPEYIEQGVVSVIEQVYHTGEPFFTRERLLKYDRYNTGIMDQGYFDIVFQPIKDKNEQVTGIFAFGVEVTKQVEARKQIEGLFAELETIFEAIPDGIFVCNSQGELIRANESGLRMLGLPEVTSIESRAKLVNALKFSYPNNTPYEIEQTPINRALTGEIIKGFRARLTSLETGQEIHLRISAAPIRDNNGQIIGAVAANNDITALYQQEQEKDAFISVVAHELKTPITSIKGFTQLAISRLQRAGVNEREVEILTNVDKQANRLVTLINELNELSHFQTDKLELNYREFDLAELVRRTGDALQITTETHPIVLDLPKSLKIQGDPARLEQVLNNLIGNAIKYSPDGGSVTVTLRPEGEEVFLAVKDQGIGIPPQDRPHLFERFRRASNTKDYRVGGFGLGLYICSEIVRAHGGRLWLAESETDGSGSTFCLTLPRLRH
jgi:PAS domain S-box-containing protein